MIGTTVSTKADEENKRKGSLGLSFKSVEIGLLVVFAGNLVPGMADILMTPANLSGLHVVRLNRIPESSVWLASNGVE